MERHVRCRAGSRVLAVVADLALRPGLPALGPGAEDRTLPTKMAVELGAFIKLFRICLAKRGPNAGFCCPAMQLQLTARLKYTQPDAKNV